MRTIVPSAEQEQVAFLLRALGHPMRVAMVAYILEYPGCICNDLVLRFGRAQATISQHLAILRDAGIVQATHEGHTTSYVIDPGTLGQLRGEIGRLAKLSANRQGMK
jgi:DNA-binding transcriptional ArsR family regulator